MRGEWLIPEAPLRGVLLYVHGGGFVSCSAATHRPITAALARFAKRRVFSVDYRLAPEYRFPAAMDDVCAAYEWLMQTLPPDEPVALVGDSAGGNLVLGLALRLRDRRQRAPACVVAFSPWTDLAATGESARSNDGADAMFRYENLRDFAAVYLGGAPAVTPEASPLHDDMGGLPPVLLHVGSTEILLDDSRRVNDRIRNAGGSCRLQVYDDVAHCWQMLVPFVPEARMSLQGAAAFIADCFRRPPVEKDSSPLTSV